MHGTSTSSRAGATRARSLAAAFLAVLATLLLPASASALEKGLETDLTWGISSADQDRTLAGLADLGAGWNRITMAWHYVETKNGQYSGSELSKYDQVINKAAASGINLAVTVYTTPKWASGNDNSQAPPLNPADYADFMSFVANRYRGKVDAWEIWNEQNAQGFWATGPDPAAYARLLRAAHPAVKAADPDALVVYGGTWQNDYAFLEGAYAEVPNLGDYYDVLGTHPYSGVSAPEYVELEGDGRAKKWTFAAYRELRDVMLDHGDDKPIWFTEFGWSTFNSVWGVSEAVQADFLTRAYRCAEQDPYVGVAIWYAFRNHPFGGDGQDWEYQLGLTRTDFSPKPSYDAFKSYTPGSGGCTYQYPSGPAVPDPPVDPPVDLPTDPPVDPATEPEPTPDPAVDEPEGEIETSTVTGSGRPVVRVRIQREWWAAASGTASTRLRPRARVAIVGRVKRADHGRVILRLQHRGRDGEWGHGKRFRAQVGHDGRFRKVRRLAQGRWRVRAVYHVGSSSKTRSRLVYFRG